jgi:hypothetical protein
MSPVILSFTTPTSCLCAIGTLHVQVVKRGRLGSGTIEQPAAYRLKTYTPDKERPNLWRRVPVDLLPLPPE